MAKKPEHEIRLIQDSYYLEYEWQLYHNQHPICKSPPYSRKSSARRAAERFNKLLKIRLR